MNHPMWAGWQYESQTLVLAFYEEGRWTYEVDLERCTTSAEVLDWIMQVASKTWATDAVIAGLVRALRDLLEPQGTLCSFGQERGPLDVRKQLARWPQRCAEQRALDELHERRRERGGPGGFAWEELCDPIQALAKDREREG